jgi:triacylglycerol lipase
MFRLSRLSPRRRAFVIGLVALLAVAATAAAVSAARAGGGSGQGAAAAHPARFPPQDRPGPVLLVPGYGGGTASLSVLAGRIRATGRQASVVRLPGDGTGSLVTDASVLDAAVTRALRGGARSVDVIGYSAGEVVTLLWARDDGGARKARRVVTLGSPFHGAAIAAAGEAFDPAACPVACQQLVPGSGLLGRLAAGAPPGPRWLSLWTTGDQTVTPPDSARLPGAVNVPIQSVCPAQRLSHSQLPVSPAVTAMVLQAIGPGPLRAPAARDCRGRSR